jgi:hypothetical protein
MEIVELVASVTQLASQTFTAVAAFKRFYHDFSNAPAQAAQLRAELEHLHDVVTYLKLTLHHVPPDHLQLQYLKKAVAEFSQLLEALGRSVERGKATGIRRAKWPFDQAQISAMLTKTEHYKTTFILALKICDT